MSYRNKTVETDLRPGVVLCDFAEGCVQNRQALFGLSLSDVAWWNNMHAVEVGEWHQPASLASSD